MRLRLGAAAALLATSGGPVAAQSLTPGQVGENNSIVVTGTRQPGAKPIPMSDWHVAETAHLLVFSKGDEKRLARVAHNLEKLHFLLSVLLNRVDAPDQTIKLGVTLIGDAADFNHLGLKNLRWQQGPYPKQFPSELYYDPREDGAVLATAAADQRILLQHGRSLASISNLEPSADGGVGQSMGGPSGAVENVRVGEASFPASAEGRLYAGFAQHYLTTYFPAAYPRWYLDGFAEIFATLSTPDDGSIEYGRAPEGFRDVMEWSGRYPLAEILKGRYLDDKRDWPAWTPYQAWALAHLLFFSEEWKAPLGRYLAAVASGAAPGEAAERLGDTAKLQRELASYRGRKVPFERMTYPADRIPPPIVRQLKQSEAGFVRGKLELGARVEIPPAPPVGADAATAERMEKARARALDARGQWLERLRQYAGRYPQELEAQLLLAEGECRSGNPAPCLAAADRALKLAPNGAAALAWRGIALAQQAIAGPASERKAGLRAARAAIARANRADTEAVLPLLAYYRTFAEAGETPPALAVDGVAKAVAVVPNAPASRLMHGEGLIAHGEAKEARRTLLPVAKGAYQSPERAKAEALLEAVSKK